MQDQTFSLSELNNLIQNLVENHFDYPLWIMAEIAELKVASNGHCYLDLLDKSEKSGKDIARARATIWRNVFPLLKAYFEEITGQEFIGGIKVMLLVEVKFHQLYGYSLNVVDINPAFTIGEIALQREKILQELEQEGILMLNKQVSFPVLPKRIAVISSENAAGYEDFLNELENNTWQYYFELTLFPAMMQGKETENSIIAALEKIFESVENYDVVVIIRGGGAKLDLSVFDSKPIAEHVAQFPIPVLSGIGHTKDQTVLDIVSHQSLKTPTAVADFLIQHFRVQEQEINQLKNDFHKGIYEMITEKKQDLFSLYISFKNSIDFRIKQEKEQLLQINNNVRKQSEYFIKMETHQLLYLPERIRLFMHIVIDKQMQRINNYFEIIKKDASAIVNKEKQQLQNYEEHLRLLEPKHLLKRGYHLITNDYGKIIKGIEDITVNDMLQIHFTKGIVTSKVEKIKKKTQ